MKGVAMSEDNLSIIRALYEAQRQKDIAVIFASFAPEMEIRQTDLLPWGGHYQGHEGVKNFFMKLTEHIDSHVDVDQLIPAGDHVVAIGHTRGTVKANGNRFDVPVAHVWTLRDGKVTRFEAYIDTPAMLAALQQQDPKK
jgi:ketosteroid isomerase-like protein